MRSNGFLFFISIFFYVFFFLYMFSFKGCYNVGVVFFFAFLEFCTLIWVVSFFGVIYLEKLVVIYFFLIMVVGVWLIFIFVESFVEGMVVGMFEDFWYMFSGLILEGLCLFVLFTFLKN